MTRAFLSGLLLLGSAVAARAGELDREAAPSPSVLKAVPAAAAGTELDGESPTAAHRYRGYGYRGYGWGGYGPRYGIGFSYYGRGFSPWYGGYGGYYPGFYSSYRSYSYGGYYGGFGSGGFYGYSRPYYSSFYYGGSPFGCYW